MDRIHIYVLSKLAVADVVGWRRIREKAKKERQSRFWSYRPFRYAAAKSLQYPPDQVPRSVEDTIKHEASKWGHDCVQGNLAAFTAFQTHFRGRFAELTVNLMTPEAPPPPVILEGMELVGGPHFAAQDLRGTERYVYLHPSRDWNEKEIEAFCELLSYVVCTRYKVAASQAWFLDVPRGRTISCSRSRKRLLERCRGVIQLLGTMPLP